MDQVATTTSGEAGAKILAEAGVQAVTSGPLVGIGLDPSLIEKMNAASESGVIAQIGDAAFRYYDDGSKWTDYKPQVGDRVFVERYAGREVLGADRRTYRLMTYTCIGGLEEPEEPVKTKAAPKRAGKKKG
jgi:hypothetical protein